MSTNGSTKSLIVGGAGSGPATMEKESIHILVIEDDAINAELVQRMFDFHHGRQNLKVVGTLKEARACLKHFVPDLVISEWRLSDGTCFELAPGPQPHESYPMIVMTSHGDEQIAVEAMKSGALDYVVKTDDSLENLPHLAERAVREWEAIQQGKEAEKLQDLQKDILEKIVLGEPVIDILNALCLQIQEMIPQTICSVMLLEETTHSLHVLSAPSVPRTMWAALDGLNPGEQSASCGTAAYTGQPVFVVDTDVDPRWSTHRDLAKQFGIRGCWSIPIFSAKKTILGTFGISQQASRSPTPFHRKLLETASYMAGITIQKRVAEDKLRASEDRYRDLYESAPCAYFTTKLNGRIMSVNSTAVQLLGYTKTNLVGRSIFDIFAPTAGGREKALAHLLRTIDVNGINGEELEMQRANGTFLWVNLTVRVIRDAKQNPIGWRTIALDITQKKRAEEELRESQKSLQQILDTMSAHVAILDEKGTILFVNGAWRRFAEMNGAQDTHFFVGKNYFRFCDFVTGMEEKEAIAVSQGIRHVISGQKKDFFMDYPCDNPTEKHWFQLRANRLNGTGPARVLISHESITEVKEAEQALRRSEAQLRQVIDLVPHFIFAKDREGRYILANQAVADVYRTTVENLIGRTDDELDPSKEEVDLFRRNDLDVIETGRVKVVEEEALRNATGQHRRLQTTKIPFVCADTTIPSILGVAIDITEHKQGEEALRLMERVFESSSDHLSIVGPDYRFQQVNPMYERVHQRPATDIVGRHIRDLLGDETFTEIIKPYFDRCLMGEEVSQESWFHFKDGQARFMLITYSPLRVGGHPNSMPAVVFHCRDLTHRKRFEEVLKGKEHRLRRLLEERSRISQDLHDHVLQSLYAIGLIIAAAKNPI